MVNEKMEREAPFDTLPTLPVVDSSIPITDFLGHYRFYFNVSFHRHGGSVNAFSDPVTGIKDWNVRQGRGLCKNNPEFQLAYVDAIMAHRTQVIISCADVRYQYGDKIVLSSLAVDGKHAVFDLFALQHQPLNSTEENTAKIKVIDRTESTFIDKLEARTITIEGNEGHFDYRLKNVTHIVLHGWQDMRGRRFTQQEVFTLHSLLKNAALKNYYVHCFNGTGRSGTFTFALLLYSLLKKCKNADDLLEVLKAVNGYLRTHRNTRASIHNTEQLICAINLALNLRMCDFTTQEQIQFTEMIRKCLEHLVNEKKATVLAELKTGHFDFNLPHGLEEINAILEFAFATDDQNLLAALASFIQPQLEAHRAVALQHLTKPATFLDWNMLWPCYTNLLKYAVIYRIDATLTAEVVRHIIEVEYPYYLINYDNILAKNIANIVKLLLAHDKTEKSQEQAARLLNAYYQHLMQQFFSYSITARVELHNPDSMFIFQKFAQRAIDVAETYHNNVLVECLNAHILRLIDTGILVGNTESADAVATVAYSLKSSRLFLVLADFYLNLASKDEKNRPYLLYAKYYIVLAYIFSEEQNNDAIKKELISCLRQIKEVNQDLSQSPFGLGKSFLMKFESSLPTLTTLDAAVVPKTVKYYLNLYIIYALFFHSEKPLITIHQSQVSENLKSSLYYLQCHLALNKDVDVSVLTYMLDFLAFKLKTAKVDDPNKIHFEQIKAQLSSRLSVPVAAQDFPPTPILQ